MASATHAPCRMRDAATPRAPHVRVVLAMCHTAISPIAVKHGVVYTKTFLHGAQIMTRVTAELVVL